jgi:Zn finger protein HypA/HybF involved in hydrogenase expression
MQQVTDSIMALARERRATSVRSVHLQVGELTFLEFDQLEFGWEIYTRNVGEPLLGTDLTLERLEARGTCDSCGYSGPLKVVDFPDSHITTPVLDCPECGQVISVTEGKDLLIRDIVMDVPDEEEVSVDG